MSTNSSKYTNSFVPVKSIANGMIILDNNLKVTGVKIFPRNIFILEPDVQYSIINNLKNVYNMIDYEFWIVCADRPVDITAYLSQLQLLYNSQQNPVKRKLIIDDINKANMFTNNNVVDTEFYLFFHLKHHSNGYVFCHAGVRYTVAITPYNANRINITTVRISLFFPFFN